MSRRSVGRAVVGALSFLALSLLVFTGQAWASNVSSPNNGWYLATATGSIATPSLDSATTATTAHVNVWLPATNGTAVGGLYPWVVLVAYCDGSRVDAQSGYVYGGSVPHAASSPFDWSSLSTSSSWCSAGHTASYDFGTQMAASSPSGSSAAVATLYAHYDVRSGAAPPGLIPACTSGQASDARVGFSSSTWYVRFHAGTVAGLDHWRFDAPNPHQYLPGSPLFSFSAVNDAVDGYPGYLYHTAAGTAQSTAAITAVDASGNGICQVSVASIVAGTVTSSGGSVGATNPDDGTSDCGLNPFCYFKSALKWAFWPSTDPATTWSAAWTSWQGHFPVNVVSAGLGVVSGWVAVITCTSDNVGSCSGFTTAYTAWGGRLQHDGTAGYVLGNNDFDPFSNSYIGPACAAPCTDGVSDRVGWIRETRSVAKYLMYVGGAYLLYRRVARSFGAKDPT
jgi:hypothetical protein